MVNINKKKKKIVLRDSLDNLQQWRSFLTGSDTASELNSTQALQSLHQWDLMGHRSLNGEDEAGVQLMSSRVRSSVSLSVSLCHRRNSALCVCVFLSFFNLSARSMTQCLFFGSLLDPAQSVHHWSDWPDGTPPPPKAAKVVFYFSTWFWRKSIPIMAVDDFQWWSRHVY